MNNYPKALAGVVGFRGYSGAELVRILSRHPQVEPVLLEHRSDSGDRPVPRGAKSIERRPVSGAGLDVVFLATPADVSMELAPSMLEAGARVIDLSGAFRLRTAERYQHWYKEPHTQPALLAEAVYGLPEFCRERIRGARLVSNPGCYPTAANLAIRPLVDAGVVDRAAGIVCDAKSGVSGAGRKPSLKTSFCEVTENFSAYSVLRHRHVPEVLLNSGLEESEFSFTAQLLPLHRGILETIYFRGVGDVDLLSIYEKRYSGEPFIRLYEPGQAPDLHSVRGTNFCDIGFVYDAASRRGVVISAIDNLVKGAAGQAVQNMNLMLGFDETAGLLLKLLIKLGGTLLDSEASRRRLAAQINAIDGARVVVHGGGKQMTRYLTERGIESRFVNGLRVTTPETMDAVVKVLAGSVNHELVAALGRRAVGLSGVDAGIAEAVQMDPELGAVGRVVRSDASLLELLTANGYIPVVACLAGDAEGRMYNVNADQMAVACAASFGAGRLIFLTDVDGVLDAEKRVRATLTVAECERLIADGVATGGMQAKLNAAIAALKQGVGEVWIANGACADILPRLVAGESIGTRLL